MIPYFPSSPANRQFSLCRMLKTAADWPLLDMANSCVLKPNFCQLNNDFKPVQMKRISSRINFSYYIYLHTRLENRAFYHKVGIKQQCFLCVFRSCSESTKWVKIYTRIKIFHEILSYTQQH
jgi:hypothetical protein